MIKMFMSLMLIITAVFILKYFGIIINISNSLPLGIYRKVEVTMIHRGDIIALCLPEVIAAEGKRKDYLNKGDCLANTKPIIKQVIAIPGDNVQLTYESIIVNGIIFKAPIQGHDHNGLPIHQFIFPQKYSSTKGYWLYGFNNPSNSWDSRYFGPISFEYIEMKIIKSIF